jgi:hypothetical protein
MAQRPEQQSPSRRAGSLASLGKVYADAEAAHWAELLKEAGTNRVKVLEVVATRKAAEAVRRQQSQREFAEWRLCMLEALAPLFKKHDIPDDLPQEDRLLRLALALAAEVGSFLPKARPGAKKRWTYKKNALLLFDVQVCVNEIANRKGCEHSAVKIQDACERVIKQNPGRYGRRTEKGFNEATPHSLHNRYTEARDDPDAVELAVWWLKDHYGFPLD